MDVLFVYVTVGSRDEALSIGRTLVEEGLAACANVLGDMTSVYRWEGNVEQGAEAVLIAKTRSDRFDALAARIVELHSYELPCILALPVASGHAPYLDWIRAESGPRAEPIPDSARGMG
jgi:periplasmic divalent cation tolerance protein